MSGDELRVICIDADAPPLFWKREGALRRGYEPDVAALVAEHLGRTLVWEYRPWPGMVPALLAHEGDAVLCGQAITPARRELVDFTRPYAIFNESVLVRAGSEIASPDDLAGLRVGALAHSTNMALAETFPPGERVAFDGSQDDILTLMVDAVRSGEIDALVDDDVALVPFAEDPELAIAFVVETRNAWGISVAKDRPELLAAIDGALAAAIADGGLAEAWGRWLGGLPFPFAG